MSIFSNEDKKKLESFLLLVDKIRQLRLFKNGLPGAKMSYRMTSEDTYGQKLELPDEALLRSALLDLRKIYAQGEITNFGSIRNLLHRKVSNPTIKENIDKIGKAYNNSLNDSSFTIIVNGDKVTPMRALDLWLNGHYFHQNQRKKDKLFKEYANFEDEIKFQFFYAVRNLAMFAFHLSQIVNQVIRL